VHISHRGFTWLTQSSGATWYLRTGKNIIADVVAYFNAARTTTTLIMPNSVLLYVSQAVPSSGFKMKPHYRLWSI